MPNSHTTTIRRTLRTLATATALLLAALTPQAGATDIDQLIQKQMRKARIPGLSAVVVVDGQTTWTGGYGWANIEEQVPVTPDTVFLTASISKTVTATAAMQLVDDGLLDLDEDINSYLPFAVRNPKHPDTPITARQLATHTSSISDSLAHQIADLLHAIGDYPLSLEEVLTRYLLEGSDFFDPDASFHPWAPGEGFVYTNIGYGLLGYLIETVSGSSLEAFTQERLFGPLEMHESSWLLANIDPAHKVVPYLAKRKKNAYLAMPFASFATYPSSMLQTSARQFGNYAAMHLESGKFQGSRILRSSSAREMRQVQFPEIAPSQGLAFVVQPAGEGSVVWHNGSFVGHSTDFFMLPELGIGIAIFTNSDLYDTNKPRRLAAMGKIHGALVELALSQIGGEN